MLLIRTVGFRSEKIAAEYDVSPSRVRALVYKARLLQLREITGAEKTGSLITGG